MPVTNNTYVIPTLGSTASFYDWFNKENTDIIAKLNLLKVYGATSGDGVLASTDTSGQLTLSIGGTSGIIQSPLSFNGVVSFNNLVNLPSLNLQTTGITTGSAGYTFGTPVRIFLDGSQNIGYTAARANSPENAEVLGLLSSIGQTYSYIALSGKISGNFSGIYGQGLSAGCIYFLEETTAGMIDDDEPQTTGSVSKPVLLGLTLTEGIVLNYRGNYLNYDTTSYGSSGSNQIVFSINTSTYTTANTDILLGDVISFSPEYGNTIDAASSSYGNRKNYGGFFHSTTGNGEEIYIVGVVIEKILIASTLYITLQLSGYTDVFSGSYDTFGGMYLTSDFDLNDRTNYPQLKSSASNISDLTLIAINYDTSNGYSVIDINKPSQSEQGGGPRSNSSSGSNNLLVNGNYEVWQRSNTGRDVSYTSTGSLAFADMWRRHDGITGGNSFKNYYITRQSFSDYQSDIEGSPNYYIDIKALGSSAASYPGITQGTYPGYTFFDHLMVGHVVENAKTFDDTNISVSFYAKTSHNDYDKGIVYLARYNGTTLLDYKVIGTVTLTTTWTRYDLTTFIDSLASSMTPLANDYCEVGIDLIPLITQANEAAESIATNVYVSIASFSAALGISSIKYHYFEPYGKQLQYCQQYYYSTYARSERIGTPTLVSTFISSETTPYLVTIPNYASVIHELPLHMRTTPSVTIYSPYSGSSNEAYNQSASRELRYTNGTVGYGSAIRSADGSTAIIATPRINNIKISLNNGYVPYDQVYYHFIADADYPI